MIHPFPWPLVLGEMSAPLLSRTPLEHGLSLVSPFVNLVDLTHQTILLVKPSPLISQWLSQQVLLHQHLRPNQQMSLRLLLRQNNAVQTVSIFGCLLGKDHFPLFILLTELGYFSSFIRHGCYWFHSLQF